ncbi:MAG: MMPL family transporter [Candidatus Dormibacteraceae bacterium]
MSRVGVRSLAAAWGALVARRAWYFLGAWVLAVAVAAAFAPTTSRHLSAAGFETDTPATRAAALLRQQFPGRQAPVLFVVFTAQVPLSDPAYQAQISAYRTDLARLGEPFGATVSGPLAGPDQRSAALLMESSATPGGFISVADRVIALHHPGPATALVGGGAAVYDSFISDSESDLSQSERVSLPIALALLLVVFGGVVAALLPVLTGLATVTVAVALLGALARVHEVSIFALNISSVVGIGLGIDYSLLVVNRFREELRAGQEPEAAVDATMSTAGLSTLVSGGTVAIGFGSLSLSRLNVLWSMGVGGAMVVGLSVLASLTLIPALLAVFGHRVDKLALPFLRDRDTRPFWHALASRVMRRPLLYILLVLAVIGVLISPAHGLRLGVVGPESLPPQDPAARAAALAHSQLNLPSRSPIVVVASGVTDLATANLIENQLQAVAGAQNVIGPAQAGPQLARFFRPGFAVFEVTQPGADNDSSTHALLNRLRSIAWPRGVSVLLGGEAAGYQDFLSVLLGDLPRILATVLVLTFVLLGLAFRSVLLPLKAVLMNLLSVGAAMGVLTWIFQQGHLSEQLNFQAVGFVDSTTPVLIFAALFGLSMDYEVFLLSRIREEWLGGRSNADAVAAGLERTGQIITSAALILVVVAGTLALSHLAINKSIGVTIAIAVLLDATLIRLVLVPAMMRVLGDRNWWPAQRTWAAPAQDEQARQ